MHSGWKPREQREMRDKGCLYQLDWRRSYIPKGSLASSKPSLCRRGPTWEERSKIQEEQRGEELCDGAQGKVSGPVSTPRVVISSAFHVLLLSLLSPYLFRWCQTVFTVSTLSMGSNMARHSDTATPPLPTFATGAVAADVEPLTREVGSVSLEDWVQEQPDNGSVSSRPPESQEVSGSAVNVSCGSVVRQLTSRLPLAATRVSVCLGL